MLDLHTHYSFENVRVEYALYIYISTIIICTDECIGKANRKRKGILGVGVREEPN